MDVLFSNTCVPPRLHQQLSSQLDALGRTRGYCPSPQYHNIIDPNLSAVDGLWVPTEFDVRAKPWVPLETLTVRWELALTPGPSLPSFPSLPGEMRAPSDP